jgi:hypothetical protein
MRVLSSGTVLSVLFMATAAQAGPVYTVNPVTLPGGYTVSGFIETDGSIAANLNVTMILDYSVTVAGGLHPFTFLPGNPGAQIQVNANTIGEGLQATATELFVKDTDGPLPGLFSQFSFRAQDNSDPLCTNCSQSIVWQNVDDPTVNRVIYSWFDSDDMDPAFSAITDIPGTRLLIATIPEPSGFICLFVAACSGLASRSKQIFGRFQRRRRKIES